MFTLRAGCLLTLSVLLIGCDQSRAPEPDTFPEHLVERFDDLAFTSHGEFNSSDQLDASDIRSRFDAVFVDDHLRVVTEQFDNNAVSARNLYLYYEGEPVFFRSRGQWQADATPHRISAWAEFSVDGEPLGMAKHLDGNSIPLPPDEAAAIRLRAHELREIARAAQRPINCDFNKTLRHGETLVSVIVPVGDNCDSGLLRLYTRSENGSTVLEVNRDGQVVGAWLDDFNDDGHAELLVSLAVDDGEALRGWRLDNARFAAIRFGELTPAQQAGFGGDNSYRVEGGKLLRRYRSSDPERGHVRMQYNWDSERWLARKRVSRDSLQQQIAGHWVSHQEETTFSVDIPVTGMLRVTQACGELLYPVMALPGSLLLTTSPIEASDTCDGAELAWSPGVWLAEMANGRLRLTGLTIEARFELERLSHKSGRFRQRLTARKP